MVIIPSIELENGKCSRCIIGECGTEALYKNFQENPAELVKLFRRENFKAIHIIDRDSLIHKKDINFDLIGNLCCKLDIPVAVHADFRNFEECENLLKKGIYRVIISNEMIFNKDLCLELINRFTTSKINFAIILNDDFDLYSQSFKEYNLNDIIELILSYNIKRIIIGTYNSIFNDNSFDFKRLMDIIVDKRFNTTLYGVISTSEVLWELHRNKSINIDSAILGAPLFNNSFPCQKIWRLIEAELEKNIKN